MTVNKIDQWFFTVLAFVLMVLINKELKILDWILYMRWDAQKSRMMMRENLLSVQQRGETIINWNIFSNKLCRLSVFLCLIKSI